jgi:hypothetical protein
MSLYPNRAARRKGARAAPAERLPLDSNRTDDTMAPDGWWLGVTCEGATVVVLADPRLDPATADQARQVLLAAAGAAMIDAGWMPPVPAVARIARVSWHVADDGRPVDGWAVAASVVLERFGAEPVIRLGFRGPEVLWSSILLQIVDRLRLGHAPARPGEVGLYRGALTLTAGGDA